MSESFHNERIVIAGLPQFHANGIDPDLPEQYKEKFRRKFGWQEIRNVESGLLVSTITNNLAKIWSVEQIWKTKESDMGWIEIDRESGLGRLVKFHNGCIVEEATDLVPTDQLGNPDFFCRHETDEMALHWVYKDTA